MELKELQEFQEEFDKKYFWSWKNPKNEEERLKFLEYVTIALAGEFGEFANVIKKMMRDHRSLKALPKKEYLEKLKEEITDCFLYILITANILHMDLEKECLKKIEFNEKRFEKYRK